MRLRKRNKSNDHQLFKVTLIVGVSDQSSGLERILKAIAHDPTLIVISNDQVRLRLLSETNSYKDLDIDIMIAEETSTASEVKPRRKRKVISTKVAPQSSRRWSEADKALAQRLRDEGKTANEIALKVGRTRTSVNQQLYKRK